MNILCRKLFQCCQCNGFIATLTLTLTSCVGYPRLLSTPFDPSGRSLNSSFTESSPQISGRYVVFVSDRRGSQDIYLYDTVQRRLMELPGLNAFDTLSSHPGVSADGRWIVFASSRQGRSGIFIYNRDTRQLQNLVSNVVGEVRNPTISSDGQTIAFEVAINGQWDIQVYSRSGQPLKIP